AGMIVKKYTDRESFTARTSYISFLVAFLVIAASLITLLPGSAATAFSFAFVVAILGAGILSIYPSQERKEVPERWYLIIPLIWIFSTLYGATQRSRLMFLVAHPVALMAGYGLSAGITELERSRVWDALEQFSDIDRANLYRGLVVLILIPVLVFNAAAAIGMAQNIGGSPNPLWMENLKFMRQETPKDSVVLSWWDYGYWFETIGARAAIADGGNLGFYRKGVEGYKINLQLADFLTAENTTKYMDWLKSLSVDYVVLDSSMIGKYSQIHHRSNRQFSAMRTFSCRSRNRRCLTTSANNETYLIYEGRGTRFLVPVERSLTGLDIGGRPLMQSQRGTAVVSNVCSEDGIREVEVPENRSAMPGCVAFHPYRQHTSLVYIPRDVMRSTLVKLYVMDAAGMERFDEVFDNGYVKM
ncbi:MAG: hypothetical protein ABEI07_00035, partial [Candidatus Nanohaloarchaea archaeon]